jgi:hypothetical protein
MASILSFLPADLRAIYQQMLAQLAGGAALDEKNALRLEAKSRERALLGRAGSDFASRGLGGGMLFGAQQDIGRDTSNALFQNIAQADARARSEAVRSMLGLGGIAAQNRATAAQRAVGMANVGAINRRTDLQAQYQEWLINQGIMQTSGFNDGTYPAYGAPSAGIGGTPGVGAPGVGGVFV